MPSHCEHYLTPDDPYLTTVCANGLICNVKNDSKLVLFAYDTIALITSNSLDELLTNLVHTTLTIMSECFT